jgi:hypothetical protein
MGRKLFVLLILGGVTLFYSCNKNGKHNQAFNGAVTNKILQEADGSISLNVDKADCYHDMINPSSNTAEWHVVISRSGRFNVWLSSATKDTTDLHYQNSVMLSILNNRLEARPECDKVILNSSDVSYPYFRADSYIGSLYIQDTGLYNIQVISDKIVPEGKLNPSSSVIESTKLISVSLTPETR